MREMCWPWVKSNVSASSAGTSNVTVTASSVSRSTADTVRGWTVACRARAVGAAAMALQRLEMVERLQAFGAHTVRLACRRAEPAHEPGAGRAAARTGDDELHGLPAALSPRGRWRDPEGAQSLPAAFGDP